MPDPAKAVVPVISSPRPRPAPWRLRRSARRGVNHALASSVSLVMLVPLYLVVVNSLKPDADARSVGAGLPRQLRFDNYDVVIEEGKLARAFVNSMIYTVFATVLCVVLACAAAFVLARNRTRLNRMIYLFLVIGIAMPINYVTLTKVMQITHLVNTEFGMVILYAAFKLPFGVFVIYAFLQNVPREIDEAAIIDGCAPRQLFWRIIMPLLRPAWITVGILTFLDLWSEFIMPLYFLSSSDKWPMTLAVYNFFGIYESSWNLVSADVVLTIIPVVVVFVFGQRYIKSGMTAGAVKG